MKNILLVTRDIAPFSDMITAFKTRDITVDSAGSGTEALAMISGQACHLMITDEILPDMTGKELIGKTVMQNPLMNCVAVSTLSPEEFHEAYEGMGVLMQFSPSPGKAEVQKLLDHLDKIHSLSKKQ